MTLWISLLVASLLAAPGMADVPDRAEELTLRTYCLHTVSKVLLATGTSYGLVLYRLNDRGFPVRAGALEIPDAVTALASTDNLVFAGNGPRGLVVIDVSNPDAPAMVARLETPGAVLRLLRLGGTLYAAMGTMGVGVIDVKDPKAPIFIKRIEVNGTTRDLCPGPRGIMVAAETFTWVMRPEAASPNVNSTGIMNPTAVAQQGEFLVGSGSVLLKVDAQGFVAGEGRTFPLGDEIRDLETFPGGVAVAASSDGLVLLESDGPQNQMAARLDPGGACTRVHARGTLLFATADAYGFAVYDVKDPKQPVKIYPAE
ncbi:MAG: hypothetical protein ABIK09_12655 [Pseudomonadota bacterium]